MFRCRRRRVLDEIPIAIVERQNEGARGPAPLAVAAHEGVHGDRPPARGGKLAHLTPEFRGSDRHGRTAVVDRVIREHRDERPAVAHRPRSSWTIDRYR